jgi:hypothetical protein
MRGEKSMNGKNKLLAIFSMLAVAMIATGILLIPQMVNAAETGDETSTTTPSTDLQTEMAIPEWNVNCMEFGRPGPRSGRPGPGFGNFGPIEVSEEFKQTVTNIAESDEDVQNLIADGYNVTTVRPIIKTVVDAEGNVVTKATSAVILLQKDTTGHASVLVNIEEAKVTQIVILTRTVIEKP